MRLAALLVLVIACSQPDQAPPSPAPTPSPTQTPTPTPNPSPAPTPGATPTPPGGADCATDADCTTTTYGPKPVKAASGCCAALACTRVETAKRAEKLAAAFSKLCSAVRCRAPDCPEGAPEPVPTCKAGRCVAR